MTLLTGFRVVQIGRGLAAAVCGGLFADVGASVVCIDPDDSTLLVRYLNHSKATATDDDDVLASADLIVCDDQCDVGTVRRANATAALVCISPYGQTGPQANDPASDLTLMFSSGIARLLTGQ